MRVSRPAVAELCGCEMGVSRANMTRRRAKCDGEFRGSEFDARRDLP